MPNPPPSREDRFCFAHHRLCTLQCRHRTQVIVRPVSPNLQPSECPRNKPQVSCLRRISANNLVIKAMFHPLRYLSHVAMIECAPKFGAQIDHVPVFYGFSNQKMENCIVSGGDAPAKPCLSCILARD